MEGIFQGIHKLYFKKMSAVNRAQYYNLGK